jgi:dihydrolipoyl dehydrogenase
MSEILSTDLVVIGGGPGGYTAAFRAADLGLKTLLVERYDTLGGVCLNVGCIPSKALLHVAQVLDEARGLKDHGLQFGEPKIDLAALRKWKDSVVSKLTGGLTGLARKRKVQRLTGEARFDTPHSLVVQTAEGVRSVRFEQAIIAVGSRSVTLPGFPTDDPRIMSSTGALALADVPKRLLIVGGGIIGLEMATVYDALGSEVTVVELADRLIPQADQDLVARLQKRIKKRYAGIHLSTRVDRVVAQKRGLRVSFTGADDPGDTTFNRILLAVGRRPNGDTLGAEAAGLRVDERGFVPVDLRQRTNVEHIFAIGDVVGQPMLAHKASSEGKVAAEVAAGLESGFDARVIPSVAYTDPELAWVGVTEQEAKAQGLAHGKGSFPWAANGRSLGMARDEGLTKLLFDDRSGRVIGGGIVGPGAGDLISEIALAIELGADAEDLALTIHPHPTLSETIAMSAEAFSGTLTDLYLPSKNH